MTAVSSHLLALPLQLPCSHRLLPPTPFIVLLPPAMLTYISLPPHSLWLLSAFRHAHIYRSALLAVIFCLPCSHTYCCLRTPCIYVSPCHAHIYCCTPVDILLLHAHTESFLLFAVSRGVTWILLTWHIALAAALSSSSLPSFFAPSQPIFFSLHFVGLACCDGL
jgi:hypothetical protein